MAVSYKKLWKLLIDKDLKKKDLALWQESVRLLLQKWVKAEQLTQLFLRKYVRP